MATGSVLLDEGATTHIGTYTFTEDAVTKEIGRAVLNNSSGTEIGTNANPVQIGDAGGSLTVDGTVAATQSGTWNITNISGTVSLPTGAATSANQTTANSSLSSIDGKITACNTGAVTISAALPAGTNNIGDVDVLTLPAITGTVTANAGTNLNTSALALETGGNLAAAATSLAIIDDWDDGADRAKIVGAVAHDAAVAGNPILQGIEARTSRQTAVANGDITRVNGDVYGRIFSIKPALTTATSNGTAITTATNTTIVAAPSAGTHLRIYRLWAQNSSATGTWCYWGNGSGIKSWPFYLSQSQPFSANVEGSWELSSATGLFLNTATTGANIEWFVQYETVID